MLEEPTFTAKMRIGQVLLHCTCSVDKGPALEFPGLFRSDPSRGATALDLLRPRGRYVRDGMNDQTRCKKAEVSKPALARAPGDASRAGRHRNCIEPARHRRRYSVHRLAVPNGSKMSVECPKSGVLN